MGRLTKLENLVAIREHLKDGIEKNRLKLTAMWEAGTRSGFTFTRTNQQYELSQDKLLKVENEIFDLMPVNSIQPFIKPIKLLPMLQCTAAGLRAILAFIDPQNTPKIAFDKDEYAQPLIDKLKEAVGGRDGSQQVYIIFGEGEEELKRQFNGVAGNIQSYFSNLEHCTQNH